MSKKRECRKFRKYKAAQAAKRGGTGKVTTAEQRHARNYIKRKLRVAAKKVAVAEAQATRHEPVKPRAQAHGKLERKAKRPSKPVCYKTMN